MPGVAPVRYKASGGVGSVSNVVLALLMVVAAVVLGGWWWRRSRHIR
jgi:multidrug resistance efflux pump